MSETSKATLVRGIRKLWLWGAEHKEALKRDDYSCVVCGVRQSRAKGKEQMIHVHHKKGEIDWDKIVNVLKEEIFCPVEDLECLCPEHHLAVT